MAKSLISLGSEKSSKRLEQIASLRSRGVGEHINLPQLVVCGDQSTGKSSVLEGITGLPFPRQEGLCTRFATEITLTHSAGPLTTNAEIIPSSSRLDSSREELIAYKKSLEDFSELPDVIREAGKLMGLRGFENPTGPAFGHDVLRIKVYGPTGLHLTVVDLPGLISVSSDDQTVEDVQTVHALADSYLSNPRTIILAVIQASNDIANQGIIQKSRNFDKSGQRTVGIITKPDLINPGTEDRIAALAKNQDTTKLKLGFFLLKNPSPKDLSSSITMQQRTLNERAYFAASPWKEQLLDSSRVGVASLREFLQDLLDQHIERELPAVRDEIARLAKKTKDEMDTLGEERVTVEQTRMFLARLAMRSHNLIAAALNGNYSAAEADFFLTEDSDLAKDEYSGPAKERLRASVHNLNTQFSHDMRLYGKTLKLVHEDKIDDRSSAQQSRVPSSKEQGLFQPMEGQQLVDEVQMKALVMKIYRRTRGRELPGNYNHMLLTELFHYQSRRWKSFAQAHVSQVAKMLTDFMQKVVTHLSTDDHIQAEILHRIQRSLVQKEKSAEEELNKICEDKDDHPVSYNHYYTDNVQKSRHSAMGSLVKKAMEGTIAKDYPNGVFISDNAFDTEQLLNAIQMRVAVDMDEQACSEARTGLDAFYKVARKTFVDNVCIQVVERHMLRDLAKVFSPEVVAGFSEQELQQIAGEREATTLKRKQLRALHSSLMASSRDLRRAA